MIRLTEIKESLLHLFFPHCCVGCDTDLLSKNSGLCLRCLHELPLTGFELRDDNPVEKIFIGRIPLHSAMAGYYFTKSSTMQRIIHEIKYKGNQDLTRQMGRLLGNILQRSGRMKADAIVPLPLFSKKQKARGYNQAELIGQGMSEIMKIPLLNKAVIRTQHTETQTRKGRVERWQNMEGKFQLLDTQQIEGKHILLVDDVITTGATLEACGEELLKTAGLLSLASLCVATK